MDFQIFPRTAGRLFEDDDIAVHAFAGMRSHALEPQGSIFLCVVAGSVLVNGATMRAGMYACIPHIVRLSGGSEACRVMMVDAKRWRGMFSLGGPVEATGRLRYIDGCTDTGLIAPPKLGDPCLNALFFPARTLQTPHTHPSHRVGAILDGEGYCITDAGEMPMGPGDAWIIPRDVGHHFRTDEHAMRIMVFHPDSEFGPTDEKHQMLEATVI